MASGTSIRDELTQLLGTRVRDDTETRESHGRDPSYRSPSPPDLVVFSRTTEEVAAIVRRCASWNVPVIPYGLGTSLEGHIIPTRGGVCVDMSQMNRIIEVNRDDMDCRVEAGVTHKAFNAHLADTDTGLFFPIGPGVECSIGGMTATGASGTNAVRYGTMRDGVLGLRVVLANGEVICTGGRARKSSAGYDLTRLFVGSEGTLGIITEVQLRLFAMPQSIAAAVCSFESMDGAVRCAIETIQQAIPIGRIELLDDVQVDAVNRYSKLDHRIAPTLFLEFHGTEAGVAEQVRQVESITRANGGAAFAWSSEETERKRLWQARHDAYYAALALRPNASGWVTDVCVPISRLAECISETQRDLVDSNLTAPIVGHVGDGNFHLVYVLDPTDGTELQRVRAHNDRMVRRALEMGGTCTGEHGVGVGKMAYLEAEHGSGSIEIMRQIKRALDPGNIMNPGKIVDIGG